MAAFLADCSLLALVLPLSLFCYALVSPRPSRLYWRAMLIFTELLVVAQVGGWAGGWDWVRLGCEGWAGLWTEACRAAGFVSAGRQYRS